MHLTKVEFKRNMDQSTEDSSSTDTESLTEISIPVKKMVGKKMAQQNHWTLHQNAKHDIPETDKSDLETFEEDESIGNLRKVPSMVFRDTGSKTWTSYNKESKTTKQERKPRIDVPLKTGDETDGEDIEISVEEFLRIIQEELYTRGTTKLKLKSHQTTVDMKREKMKEIVPKKCQIQGDEDETDCSDVDVSMMDYYAIRHQNQSTIHKKKVRSTRSNNFRETDSDSEIELDKIPQQKSKAKKENDSDTSDLEVNIKDYYVIRHETAPKCVSGPFEIDFGQTTLQSSTLKRTKRKHKTARLVPIWQTENDKNTDDEEFVCPNDDSTFRSILNAQRAEFDLKKYQSASTECHHDCKNKAYEEVEETDDESDDDNTDVSEPQSDSASIPTEFDAVDISPNVSKSAKSQPIIRLVEIDGCQGAVGVLCEPTSPTRDNVYGIKFIDMDKTEEFSNLTEAEDDAEMMEKGNYAPATDDEEISDLEFDNKSPLPSHVLPDCKKKVCHIKTTLDGKTISTENLIKLDDKVSMMQFVEEMENLSESDVCDWSEEEVKIVRRMSADFTNLKKSPIPPQVKVDTKGRLKPHNSNNGKKGGSRRKRGRKKSDQGGKSHA